MKKKCIRGVTIKFPAKYYFLHKVIYKFPLLLWLMKTKSNRQLSNYCVSYTCLLFLQTAKILEQILILKFYEINQISSETLEMLRSSVWRGYYVAASQCHFKILRTFENVEEVRSDQWLSTEVIGEKLTLDRNSTKDLDQIFRNEKMCVWKWFRDFNWQAKAAMAWHFILSFFSFCHSSCWRENSMVPEISR